MRLWSTSVVASISRMNPVSRVLKDDGVAGVAKLREDAEGFVDQDQGHGRSTDILIDINNSPLNIDLMNKNSVNIRIDAPLLPGYDSILSEEALSFLASLASEFAPRVRELLAARVARQTRMDAGELPDFLAHTADIRRGDWRV